MSAEAEMNSFIRGSVGYVEVTAGQTATANKDIKAEINAIIAIEDAVIEAEQYGGFTNGTVNLTKGETRFGKFSKILVSSGTVIIYSSSMPTIS